ncbi:M20/M25/M40 family metallo-hydrolase [Gammaproteobacteria bacterium]|nr:M20/M25/M40 family metallo-hydrolase [bacterium]MDA9048997.1 M20/M25/M40 family metallo-hydrolase [Gammaproteobacteria bacterium]MDB9700684.1 M20/M25/M40 family metallo-hydrolase [Gammaproteobacteria bacterium]MDC1326242.1 M20/M25/M40 family metallo-hydrolase [Gammaproteobacteria bacterium]MDC1475442.1 M20/M25/M40 family metallo-hydrolase [Gammaproteobacteria bacterium]|tara:strand:- start:3249 stop:4667 length:1419 start_codon:yes stop_codon:yes gene_type:complete
MSLPFTKSFFVCALFFTLSLPAEPAGPDMPYGKKALEIYKTAVELRTAKGHGQVPALAHYLAAEFKKGGFDEKDIHVLEMEGTAALVVRYRGDGSLGKMPISISAHMDVVDAMRDDWARDPFTLVEEDGYFFGRGTVDDKLGMTAVVASFLRLKSEGWIPGRDLIIAFSGDEETGMTTTKALVNEFRHLTDSEFVLNADSGGATLPEDGGIPASFGMQAAEKTYVTWEMIVRNPGGHSSRPRSDNAIYDLSNALVKIQNYQFPVNYNNLTLAFFQGIGKRTEGALGKAMRDFSINPDNEAAIAELRSHSSYVGTTGTTCVATMLKAGHAENALPQSAVATINCRVFPGTGVDDTLAQLKQVISNPDIEFKMLAEPTETDPSPLRLDVLTALQKAIDIKFPGLEIIPSMSSGGTDGMHFRAAGIPSYGVNGGYGKASDNFSHGLNERVQVQSFYDNIAHWYVLLPAIASKQDL